MIIEERCIEPELRITGEGEERRINGLGIPFDSWSEDLGGFRELIEPDVVIEPLDRRGMYIAFNHDRSKVLGTTWAKTATVTRQTNGAYYDVRPPKGDWVEYVMDLIDRGDVPGSSFRFVVPKGGDVWDRRDGMLWRRVSQMRVREMGPVLEPAYAATEVHTRSLPSILERANAELETGPSTDFLRRKLALSGD